MRTREKTNEKHAGEKSIHPSSNDLRHADMFPAAGTVKPLGEWSSAAQLFAVTGLSDADLRRLANPNNPSPTGAPWIAKPRGGRYETVPTLCGIIRHLRHSAERTSTDHPTYATMELLETHGHVPREAQKFAARQGVAFIKPNRTVESEPVRKWCADILRKLFSKGGPQLKEINGLETWDKDTELAKKLREDRIKLEDEREIRHGTLVDREIIEETIFEKWLSPARTKIQAAQKSLKRQLRTILQGDGTLDHKLAQGETAVNQHFESMLNQMATHIPKK